MVTFCSVFLQAAAYYFHGLILDEGYEDNTHAEALSCLKAAHAHLKESQKARTEFGNMEPLTKYATNTVLFTLKLCLGVPLDAIAEDEIESSMFNPML